MENAQEQGWPLPCKNKALSNMIVDQTTLIKCSYAIRVFIIAKTLLSLEQLKIEYRKRKGLLHKLIVCTKS